MQNNLINVPGKKVEGAITTAPARFICAQEVATSRISVKQLIFSDSLTNLA